MVAEAEVVFQQSLPAVLEIELFDGVSSAVKSPVSSPKLGFCQSTASVSSSLTTSPVVRIVPPNFPTCLKFSFFFFLGTI